MRLSLRHRSPRGREATAAISNARAAGTEAGERLASAAETRKATARLADHEQRTVIQVLRDIRERNNLAALILDSTERGKRR